MPYADITKPPKPLPQNHLEAVAEGISLLLPLSRRGTGPGLILLVPSLDKALAIEEGVPSLPVKWAEEGYTVVAIEQGALKGNALQALQAATTALKGSDKCEPKDVVGLAGKPINICR